MNEPFRFRRTAVRSVYCALFLGLAAMPASLLAADFHVAPGGDDSWSGRLAEPLADGTDGPFASISRARDAVRALRERDPDRQAPVVVELRGGFYELAETFVLEPRDSGTEDSPTIYRAHGDERPILSGGRRLDGWTVDESGRWVKELPAVKEDGWAFSQLFVDDERRFRPRMPAEGYYRIAGQLEPTDANAHRGHDRFVYAGDDLRVDWRNLDDVEVLAIHIWSASRMRIAEIDAEKRIVRFTAPTRTTRRWGAFPEGHRYLAINVHEALDTPGEWYLDRRRGKLTYLPHEGESPATTTVVAPRLEQLVRFAGESSGGRRVRHIRLEGLTFAHARWTCPETGNSYPQAEMPVAAAISLVGVERVRLQDVCVRHVGGYAIAFGAACRHSVVEGCELFDLGAGGVKIGHTSHPEVSQPSRGDLPTHTSHITVRDCLIAHGGRLHPAAVGVWIGHASHNTIVHNDIHDLYYTAVSVGWTWGYGKSLAHHNEIAHNHMYRIGQRVLSDMGGVYTLGVSPGTTVHHNKIHDVYAYDYGGWGLYTDEGSTDIEMHSNIVYRTKTGSFHQHYGKENRIYNNILVDSERWQVQRTRTEDHLSFEFVRNVVAWKTGPLLGSNWKDNNFKLDYNVYHHMQGEPVRFPGDLTLDEWREQRDQDGHSVIADPLFVAPEKDDYRLRDGSPAFKLGFEPLDLRDAGRKSPRKLTAGLPEPPTAFR